MKSLGVIGGLGPMASAYFLERLIDMTDAKTDQDHLDVILFDRPPCLTGRRIFWEKGKAPCPGCRKPPVPPWNPSVPLASRSPASPSPRTIWESWPRP